jgi:hypothetical protein
VASHREHGRSFGSTVRQFLRRALLLVMGIIERLLRGPLAERSVPPSDSLADPPEELSESRVAADEFAEVGVLDGPDHTDPTAGTPDQFTRSFTFVGRQSDSVRRRREQWLLDQIVDERYRAALLRLFDGTRGANLPIGDARKAGISLRTLVIGSLDPFTVAYLSAPGVNGFRYTHDLSLGYWKDDWSQSPSRRAALEAYCAKARQLRGARRLHNEWFEGIELAPKEVIAQVDQIAVLLRAIATEMQTPEAA